MAGFAIRLEAEVAMEGEPVPSLIELEDALTDKLRGTVTTTVKMPGGGMGLAELTISEIKAVAVKHGGTGC